MGQISGRLLTQLMNARNQQVVSLRDYMKGVKHAQEQQGTVNTVPQLLKKGYDPLHAIYVSAQNFVSLISEELSNFSELNPFIKIAERAVEEYMPQGPPISPLTGSYFNMWLMFDARFGVSRETMGTCLLDLGKPLGIPGDMLEVISLMQASRMGIYEHCGFRGNHVILRDLADGVEYISYVGSRYNGQKGQLWFARIFPPPQGIVDYHLVFTTPYVLLADKQDWVEYLNRAILKVKVRGPRPISEMIHQLMKWGFNANYWNEFVFLSYSNYQTEAVFLAGIPDKPESLPHA